MIQEVKVGSTVKILYLASNETETLTVGKTYYDIIETHHDGWWDPPAYTREVTGSDSDLEKGVISDETPIAKAVLGKRSGEVVVAKTPNGNIKLKIMSVLNERAVSENDNTRYDYKLDSINYEGEGYTLRNGIWYDDSFIAVPKTLQFKLNTSLSKTINFSDLPLDELIETADGFKKGENYNLALDAYRLALRKSNVGKARYILPRVTSCLRSTNRPEKAIDTMEWARKRFGNAFISPALLTSVAAAFCDINEYEKAKKHCNRAFAMTNGNAAGELSLVFQRIKSAIKEAKANR